MPVNHQDRQNLMETINAYTFAIDDIMLYLDTHPHDTEALEKYHSYRKIRKEAKERYVCDFGPLTKTDVTAESVWTWINDPWPWEGGDC